MSQKNTDEDDKMNQEVDSKDEVMHVITTKQSESANLRKGQKISRKKFSRRSNHNGTPLLSAAAANVNSTEIVST